MKDISVYYNPVTQLLHVKVDSSWSIGYDTTTSISLDIQLSPPPAEIAEQLVKIGVPEDHLDILEPWCNAWKVRGADVESARPRGWFDAETVAKMKKEREILIPGEQIIGCTREGKSNWLPDTAEYLLHRKCALCSAPATILADTLIPPGLIDELEGCRIMKGNRILFFCDTHIPADCPTTTGDQL